jgi:3-hydroxybutyrate dehydrogenase
VRGLVAWPFEAGYVSAKRGVIGVVKTLALEGADGGIAATALCPGFVRASLVGQQIRRPGARAACRGSASSRA